MKFFQSPNAAQKPVKTPPRTDFLPKDAITLSSGKPADAFLESALGLLSAQQPVWVPSPEELIAIHQQQAMLSMMAAIRQGEKQGADTPHSTANEHDNLLEALNQLSQPAQAVIPIDVQMDKEFINLDSQLVPDGDHRVTLGVASRAVFAKSASAAKKFQMPVACFVASIKNNVLAIVFHCSSDGSRSINVELGDVAQSRLTEAHIALLTEQFGMVEQQARVLAATIALQAVGYNESITAGIVQGISDSYRVDHEGMLRVAVSIEKWRVMRMQPRIDF